MDTTGQAGVKAAHRSHDINTLEVFRSILFKDGCVLYGIFIGTGSAVDITHTTIPRRWGIGMVVGDLAVLDDHVMREYATHGLVETTADGILRYGEIIPRPGMTCPYFCECLIYTVECNSSRVSLEVGSRTVTLNGIAPLWNLPLKLYLWLCGRLGQANLNAVTRSLDVTSQVYNASQSCYPQTGNGPTTGIQSQIITGALVKPTWGHRPTILAIEVTLLWLGNGGLVPGMAFVNRIAEGVTVNERALVSPVIIEGMAEQDTDAQVDINQTGCYQFTVHDDARGNEHGPSPLVHGAVVVVTHIGVLERAPAADQGTSIADTLIAGEGLIEEVEEVVVQRNNFLHEFDILHQAHEVVGEDLDGAHGADTAGIEGRGVNVASLHQTELFASIAAHLQSFKVEFTGEGIESSHNVADGAIAVLCSVRGLGLIGLFKHAGIGLLYHLLTIVNGNQILLEDVVIEHVLCRFAQVENPLAQGWRLDAISHILSIDRAGGMVITADTTDAAGDKVGIAWVFALHEEAIAAEERTGQKTT